MITFYPRDVGLWRKYFDFGRDITAEVKYKGCKKTFHDRAELIEFLKSHGVRLDDPEHPLEFDGPDEHHVFGYAYTVKQFFVIGWMTE
jgi:hypothetical protein